MIPVKQNSSQRPVLLRFAKREKIVGSLAETQRPVIPPSAILSPFVTPFRHVKKDSRRGICISIPFPPISIHAQSKKSKFVPQCVGSMRNREA